MIDLTIKKSDGSDIQTLALSGEFDLFDKEQVLDLLPKLIAIDSQGLIIDLTDIKLLTSAGIEVLIRFHEEFKKNGKRVGIILDRNNYIIRKFRNLGMFEGTGLELFTTVEEAVAALES
ncbi:MAG: STAS domain-containing protein [Candidatus Aquicultor sp.]